MIHVWFFVGLVLTILLKPGGLGSAVARQIRGGVPLGRIVADYFWGDHAGAWTTVITFAVGWLFLGLYIGEVAEIADWAASRWIGSLPEHPAVALILGVAVELAAPAVIQWFSRRLGGAQ